MSQRFGGKFSPNNAPQGTIAAPRRIRLMFILPFLFGFSAFLGEPDELLLGLVTFAALLSSAYLTREGLRAQAAYDARVIARRPALPRKILAACLMAVGLAIGARNGQIDLVTATLLGIAGAILHLFAFGLDPLKNKGSEGVDTFQNDRVARYVDEAEGYLDTMITTIATLRERSLDQRVATFSDTARGLFRNVESDPGDLTAARKYLTVYLVGARDATIKFADHYRQTRDGAARRAYEELLRDLETTFARRSQALLGNNKTDLNIEIQVLRERLKYQA